MDTKDEDKVWDIRKDAGMVFQNPDNQIIASVVEEDVAFGPENLGFAPEHIRANVDMGLKSVHMERYKDASPNKLSGGQKQRVAVAGILAMEPKCIILDEPTAMLDPSGRREVMETIEYLNHEKKITIIYITHHMEEAARADRIVVMDHGHVVMNGKPREIFSQVDAMKALGLDVPQVTELAWRLRKRGTGCTAGYHDHGGDDGGLMSIEVKDVSYLYEAGTPFEMAALNHVSLTVGKGEFIGLIGHTGSGKSTLIQHLNALLEPASGRYCMMARIYLPKKPKAGVRRYGRKSDWYFNIRNISSLR